MKTYALSIDGRLTDDGFYLEQNAAALLMRTDDALIISFRGTNDLSDVAIQSSVDASGLSGIGIATEVLKGFAVGGAGGGILAAAGAVGKGAVSGLLKLAQNSPDVADWFDLDGHYDLFDNPDASVTDDLETLLEQYLSQNPEIKTVYVTGHSLGAGMANAFIYEHPDGLYGVDYESITFATPGFEDGISGDTFYFRDDIKNYIHDDDIIRETQSVEASKLGLDPDFIGDVEYISYDQDVDRSDFQARIQEHVISSYLESFADPDLFLFA